MRRNSCLALLALGLCLSVLVPSRLGAEAGIARPRVALVLSGGSAFGIAHVGVIEAIEAAGIPIDMVVGTSMGSIVGGLYAAGYSPAEMEAILAGLDWNAVFTDFRASAGDRFERSTREDFGFRMGWGHRGLSLGEGLMEGQNVLALFTALTAQSLSTRSFDELPVPYRAVAADLLTGDKVVIGSGSLPEAMRSSMSIPGVFKPYVLDGRLLVDGGMVDNLAVDVAREMGAEVVIAVESRGPDPASAEELTNPVSIAAQTANLMILQNMKPSRAAADLYIRCDLRGFSTASYREAGRAARPGLAALAARISSEGRGLLPGPGAEPNRAAMASAPVLSAFRVEGGENQDQGLVWKIFSPLLERAYSREELRAAIGQVYSSGRFDLVKFSVEESPSGAIGVVELVPDRSSLRAALLGGSYSGIFGTEYASSFSFGPAMFIQDLTGKDSAFLLSSSLLGKVSFEGRYFQPLGPFFAEPWLRYGSEYDSFSYSDWNMRIGLRYRSLGAGLWTGLALGPSADLALGYSWESIISPEFSDTSERKLSALKAYVAADGRDAPTFAERGLAFWASGRWASSALGGNLGFAQAELWLDAAIPLSKRDTLGLALFAGTDFVDLVSGAEAAPTAFYSKLSHPGLFVGLSPAYPDSAGDHALSLGLEYRRRMASFDSIFGRSFAFGNLSLGTTAGSSFDAASLPLIWCGTAGFEFRLSRAFGALIGLGICGGGPSTSALDWGISFKLGSFIERPRDRR
jgi:NTE family protein